MFNDRSYPISRLNTTETTEFEKYADGNSVRFCFERLFLKGFLSLKVKTTLTTTECLRNVQPDAFLTRRSDSSS